MLLHKIMPGIADGSFGLEVAALAQLPESVISRARDILGELVHTSHTALPKHQPAQSMKHQKPNRMKL